MARVTYIKHKAKDMDREVCLETMELLLAKYNHDNLQVDLATKQKRISTCINCENLNRMFACEKIGSCRSGRKDFFTMHLNRNSGGCPIGQW